MNYTTPDEGVFVHEIHAHRPFSTLKKVLSVMKLTAFITLVTCLHVNASVFSQKISLNVREAPLEEVINEVGKQSGFAFLYDADYLKYAQPVTIKIKNVALANALNSIFSGQDFTWDLSEGLITITPKKDQGHARVDIKGTVTTASGETLPGATIKVKNQAITVITNSKGEFELKGIRDDAVLIISFTGYLTKEISVSQQQALDIILQPDLQMMDEVTVVAVGYGTQTKSSLTASLSTIKGNDIAQKPIPNLSNALGGRLSGVLFTQGSGEPGKDGSNILIRGRSTTGNTSPLVIVDGIKREYARLDPHSIASISVLKDAAAVAPYGMAGANGVILITTKEGHKGTPSLSYNTYVGWQNPTIVTKFANAYEYATLSNMANENGGSPRPYSDADLQKFQDGSDPDGHPNHNVLDELITRNTLLTNHNLELAGGSEKIKYYTGLNYVYQEGMWGPTKFNQYNLISKVSAKATSTTDVTLSINGRVEDHKFPGSATSSIFYQAFRTPPIAPLFYSNGLPGPWMGRNAYNTIYNSGFNKNRYTVMYNQFEINQQLPFIKGLSAKAVVAYDLRPTIIQTWLTPMPYYTLNTSTTPHTYIQSGNDGPAKPTFTEQYSEEQAFTYQGYLNYANSFGKHKVTGLFVAESRNTRAASFAAGRTNYNINVPELNTGSSDPAHWTNSGVSSQTKQRSLIYRLTYNFDGKYLFETSGRYDGSYYFAPGHRYGFFPAVSAGWRLSEESFIKNNLPWVKTLKIRGSYGEVGALAGSAFQYLSSYNVYNNSAVINGNPTQGIYESAEPNTKITWERATKMDIGLETNLWNDLLTIEADYFTEKRNNMLVVPDVVVPLEYGIGIAQVNGGKMSNRGIDFTIGSSYCFTKDLRIGLSGNLTYAKNKLLQVYETAATFNNPGRRQTDRPLGTKFGYQALGYFQVADDKNSNGIIEASEYPVTQPWGTVRPGDLKYQDTNGDGKINDTDMVPIGNGDDPRLIYGIAPRASFKGFDLEVLFQGASERDFYLYNEGAWPFYSAASVLSTALDVWTPANPNAANPRVTPTPATNNTQMSSWWVRRAGYLRLKSFELGYNFPLSFIKHAKMQSARIFMAGQNVHTWSPLQNYDPEISAGNGWYYPQQKAITFGLNVKF